ncbi:MAG TPA: hypothetical protein VI861_00780 [Rickettsiales bacterium]|nr:hypothetical protein [Rickettsiales bacterium]
MIFLKSMVFMLFIVLVTLVAALFIVKSKKMHFGYDQKVECKKQEAIKIKGNIVNIIGDKMSVLILTQADRNGKQELIKIDSRCGNEELRVLLQKVE